VKKCVLLTLVEASEKKLEIFSLMLSVSITALWFLLGPPTKPTKMLAAEAEDRRTMPLHQIKIQERKLRTFIKIISH